MLHKILHIVPLFGISLLLYSCDRSSPAGFWTGFEQERITVKESDQGPRGGHRRIVWNIRPGDQPFAEAEIITFAQRHGWVLVDSSSYLFDMLNADRSPDLKCNDGSVALQIWNVLPELSKGDNKILIFRTGLAGGSARERL